MNKYFTIVITQDEDGVLMADVPNLPGCHTQAKTYPSLMKRIREAIDLYLEVNGAKSFSSEFVGLQHIKVGG